MNENDISRIAAAISDLRPDWPAASLRTLLRSPELKNKPRRDVAVALTWVACESETKLPKRVLESGPWWRAAAVEHPGTTIARPPRADEACPSHPASHRDNCAGCAADRLAGTESPTRPTRPPAEVATRGAALAKQLLHPPSAPAACAALQPTHTDTEKSEQ